MENAIWKAIKIVLAVLLLAVLSGGVFLYRVTRGFPIYEKEPIEIGPLNGSINLLVYSKANGFVHKKGIAAAERAFKEMADENNWSVNITRSAGVFNTDQLDLFDVVIWNNVTGRTLTEKQRKHFKNYILAGGGFIGLHGAGDFSHRWKWYEDTLIGASFSHHTMNPQLQDGVMYKTCGAGFFDCSQMSEKITLKDEWYVFHNNPVQSGGYPVYNLDPTSIDPNGNFLFLARDKDWGMAVHPIIWVRCVGNGRAFYSALGHTDTNYRRKEYLDILRSAVLWTSGVGNNCTSNSDAIR